LFGRLQCIFFIIITKEEKERRELDFSLSLSH